MQTTVKEKKGKLSATVRESLISKVDEYAESIGATRSDLVERALESWLRQQAELADEAYFASAAKEMNADARDWNALTSKSVSRRKT
jgi:metal-responsive CopG/Arc/MetJ family transcriptional regulator